MTCSVWFLLPAHGVVADVTTLAPVRDNTLIQSASGARSNGAGMFLFAGRTGQISDSLRRGLIAFDIAAAIPARSTIVSVRLKLHLSKTAVLNVLQDIRLHRALSAWGEGTSVGLGGEGAGANAAPGDATWIHTRFDTGLWANPGGDFTFASSATQAVGDPGDYTWGTTPQMVADVQAWLDDPASAQGWVLIGNESTARSAKRFASRENADTLARPELTVVFTPPVAIEPSAWSRIKQLYR